MTMTATAPTGTQTGLSEQEQRNLAAINEMIAQLNAHSPSGMLATMADEMVWFDVAMEEPYRGKEEIGAFLEDLFRAFPDLRYEPTSTIVRGDRASVTFDMTGTHSGTFYGLPATHREVHLPCHSAITLRDGVVLRDDCYFDNTMVLRQVGLMPPLSVTLSTPGKAVLWTMVKTKQYALPLVGVSAAGFVVRRLRKRRRARAASLST